MKIIVYAFLIIVVTINTSCNRQQLLPVAEVRVVESHVAEEISPSSNEPENTPQEPNENSAPEELPINGTWTLDKIALTTKGYSGEIMGDVRKYETEGFVGSELEYTQEFFRWNENKYYQPIYEIDNITVDLYHSLIPSNYPTIYEFIELEGIKINGMEKYENLGDVPLVSYQVSCEWSNDEGFINFIPIGSEIYLLNDDTMLVGLYGHVFLAHRKTV